MDETTYEYECMRAELLGTQRPSLEEYLDKHKDTQVEDVEQEQLDIENLKAVDHEAENLENVSGGLHELSSILSSTQKKLNSFKVSCGSSLTNLLKTKVGFGGSRDSIVSNPDICSKQDDDVTKSQDTEASYKSEDTKTPMKSDLSKALENRMDALDRLIDNAESCQYRMQDQNKQMKKFLQ